MKSSITTTTPSFSAKIVSKVKAGLSDKLEAKLKTKPSNAFLLFLTGFLFSQFMLVNILYTKNPLGGWITPIGTITTPAILVSILVALSICLIVLWKSVSVTNKETNIANKTQQATLIQASAIKGSLVKTRNNYSPIDFPRGSTKPVVSGYAFA